MEPVCKREYSQSEAKKGCYQPIRGWESVTRIQTVISAHLSPWVLASQIGSLHSDTILWARADHKG